MKPSNPLSLSILVVEDDWLLRQQVVANLQDQGCSVIEAEAGQEALALLDDDLPIDLLITDIRLADEISGWDVAQAFREHDESLPVIYASSSPADDIRRAKGTAFLSKPYSASDLIETCRKLTKR